MSDQEKPAPGYEPGLPHKPANLDSKVPIHTCDGKGAAEGHANNAGYYLNVAQKGKLILPTALWILLIIAGVSFITLLATLNKSINTLDALVELEQEKEALAVKEHFIEQHRRAKLGHGESERHQNLKQATAKPTGHGKKHAHPKEMPHREDIIEIVDLNRPGAEAAFLMPLQPSSWLSLPSWTSLEPVHRQQLQRPPMPPMGLIDEMMRGAPDAIIIQDGPSSMGQPPMGLLNSFMKHLEPVFDRLMPALDGLASDEPPPSISAKIDNLNVHINPEHKKQPAAPSRAKEVDPLEKSIDELVDKLMMGPPAPRPMPPKGQPHHRRPHASGPHASPPRPMAPLADLLLPPALQGPEDGAMFFQFSTFDEPQRRPLPKHKKHKKQGADEMQPDGQLIISIADVPEMPLKPSGEMNRHHANKPHRPLGLPYEQATPDDIFLFNPFDIKPEPRPAHHHKGHPDHHVVKPGKFVGEAPWDLLANEMAKGLVEDVLSGHGNKQPGRIGAGPDEPQIAIIDDMAPLASGGHTSSVVPTVLKPHSLPHWPGAPALNEQAHKSQVERAPQEAGDMLTMLFGLAPDSKLTLAEQKQQNWQPEEKANHSASLPASESPAHEFTTTTKATDPPTSISELSTMSSMEPTMSPEAKKEVDAIIGQMPKGTTPDGEGGHKSAVDELLQDFMRPLFTLPQMSGNQQSVSTNGSSSGSADFETTKPMIAPTSPAITPTPETPAAFSPETSAPINATTGEPSRLNSIFSKVIGFFKDQQPANQTEELKTITAIPSTIESESFTTPPLKEDPTKITTTFVNQTPLVEMIGEQEALDQLPVIDLAPFTNPSEPFERLAEKTSATPPLANSITTSKLQPSTGGLMAGSSSSTTSSTTSSLTTSKPKVVSVSEADLAAETSKNKSFFQKANDVLERQILGLKRFLSADKP